MVANRIAFSSLLLVLAMIFVVPSNGMAQKSEFKGDPEKIMQEANSLYAQQRFSKAKEAYIEVLKKDPENFLATIRVGKCSYFIQEYDDAARYFESALEIDKTRNDTVFFELGMTYRVLDRQNDANEMFVEFRKRWKEKDEYAKRVKLEIEGTKFVEKQREEDPKWRVNCLDMNSAMGDNFPSVMSQTEDEEYLVYTTSATESKGSEIFEAYNEGYSDLWIAKIEDDTTFGEGEPLGKKINTKGNDGNATFSPDGMTMYYSICNQGKLGYGCSIYMAKYDPRKKKWGKPKLVESLQGTNEVVVNSRGKVKKVPTYDVHPMLSEDGNTMFFVSDRAGGEGRLDIWYATNYGEGEWSEPINVGARINSPFDDISPFLSRDGNTLYFSSNGRVGFGGFDLFKSEGGIGSFGEPENMGAPINSTYDDLAGFWSDDDSSAYFTSNRVNCVGRDDIYWAKQIEALPPEFAVHGIVLDKKTQMPIPFATVILFQKDFEGDLIPLDTFRTDQSASYNFQLEADTDYKILGNAPEYLANEENLSTKDMKESVDFEVNINIELERIEIEVPIVLNDIYYDFDEFFLRDDAMSELDNLVKLLNLNQNITIRVGSHTDSNGSEDYNKNLSENRAREAVRYIIENGISSDRVEWFGYGESELIYFPEKDDREEQLNRRSEFRILTIDYVPN